MTGTRFNFKLNRGAAALLAALSAPGAWAQSAPAREQVLPEVRVSAPEEPGGWQPDTSSVGGKGDPQLLRDIPQSVVVIKREVMDAQGAASLQEALRYIPGITLGAAEGGTIGNNINLRGFSARTDVYLDGARDRGQYYRDAFFLDSVEVLKGPSSMLFGRGSTGGVVNQVSKLPTLAEKNELTGTIDSNGSLRSTADINHALSDTSAWRVAMMVQDTQTTRNAIENRDYGIAPSLRFGIGTPTEFTVSGLFLHNRDMPDYGVPPLNGRPVDVSKRTFYGLTDDRTIQDVASLGAQLRHRIAPGLTLHNQTRYTRYEIDARESGPNSVGTLAGAVYTVLPTRLTGNTTALPQGQLFAQLGSHDRQITDEGLYNQTDLSVEFGTGEIRHTLVAGLELGRDTYRNQSLARSGLPVVSVNDPSVGATPAGSVTTYGNLADASATTVAPYLNDTIELNRHWKFVGGMRFDRYSASISNSVPSATTPASARQTIALTSVRSGLIYQPTETLSWYASYGTSFDPSLETLTVTNGTQALPPVKNRSHEAGVKWDVLKGKLSLTGALFRIEQTNARSQVSAGVYELTGNVRVRGFELGAVGNLTPHWRVLAGYANLDARIVQASALDGTQGNVPANTPRHSASLWTSWDFAPHWELGGGATHLSSRFASNTNFVSVPGYTRYDAMLAYHQPKYDLRLNLLNLGNRYYYDTVIPSDGGRAVPGIGRTAQFTVAWRF